MERIVLSREDAPLRPVGVADPAPLSRSLSAWNLRPRRGETSFIGLDAATGRVDVVDYENDDVTYLYQPLAGSLASMDAVFTALSAAVREDLAGDDGEITTAGIYAADPQRFADWSMSPRG